MDGPLASQPEPDGGPRTIIQNKGAITDPCVDGPCDSGPEAIESSNAYVELAKEKEKTKTKTKSKSNPPAQGSSRWVLKDDGSYIWRAGRR